MKAPGFYLHWISFLLGLFFGVIGVFFALLTPTQRRDRIYSSLLGCGIGMVITILIMKLYPESVSTLLHSSQN